MNKFQIPSVFLPALSTSLNVDAVMINCSLENGVVSYELSILDSNEINTSEPFFSKKVNIPGKASWTIDTSKDNSYLEFIPKTIEVEFKSLSYLKDTNYAAFDKLWMQYGVDEDE